jgi:RimJ/RimL family protein N-acetyltransferase
MRGCHADEVGATVIAKVGWPHEADKMRAAVLRLFEKVKRARPMQLPEMTKNIITARLRLLPFTAELVSARYVAWLNDPQVVRYSEQRHRSHSLDSCHAFVATFDQQSAHMWAIVLDDLHIGNITAHRNLPNKVADIGILIGDRSTWGHGYGAEAWTGVRDWLLDSGCRKVTAGAMAANVGMLAVFEKTGMVEEGRRVGYFLLDGRPVDMVLTAFNGGRPTY